MAELKFNIEIRNNVLLNCECLSAKSVQTLIKALRKIERIECKSNYVVKCELEIKEPTITNVN